MGIFSKNKIPFSDFSMIGTDVHSHVLPGMDDGSPSLNESLKMLREMEKAGFKKIITTPHVISAVYPNTKEQILGQMHHLRESMAQEGISIGLEASGEYHLDYEFLGKVESGEVIPFGQNYLIVELPFQKPIFSYEEILFKTRMAGYQPIIPHPERYTWLMGKMKLYQALKDQGLLFQVNLNSLNGLYGFPARITARQLIDAGMIEFTGSDAHHAGHIVELSRVLRDKYFIKLVGSGQLLNSKL